MEKSRNRNYKREAALETIRYVEGVKGGLYEVLGDEVLTAEDKTRLHHFRRGMNFVLKTLREKL